MEKWYFLREFIGDANALKYKTEADSALSIVTKVFCSISRIIP